MKHVFWGSGSILFIILIAACGGSTANPPSEEEGIDSGLDAFDGNDEPLVDGSDENLPDGEEATDAGDDDGPPPITPAQGFGITAGSESMSSAHYGASVHVGAPMPYGSMQGSGKKLQLGPAAP